PRSRHRRDEHRLLRRRRAARRSGRRRATAGARRAHGGDGRAHDSRGHAPRRQRGADRARARGRARGAAMTDARQVNGDGMAGRLLLVVDAAVSPEVQQVCADLAARLADQAGMPVSVAAVPVGRLDALQDSLRRDAEARRREYAPSPRPDPAAPMSSAPFVWNAEGRPDWGSMWTAFCELALYGGPPQRGPASALRGPGNALGAPAGAAETDAEML